MPAEFSFDESGALAAALASRVAETLRTGFVSRGEASLAVSGGRTPKAFLEALSNHDLDWTNVWVTLADERWVNDDHADSNEALVRRHLLKNHAVNAPFVGLKNGAATPQQGEAECERALAAVPQPFDIVVLGIGDDGHTASLFPHAPQLHDALDMNSGRRCIEIDPRVGPTPAPHPRMSLTLPALLYSRAIVLLISGEDKWNVYREALKPGPVEALPVRAILSQSEVPVEVYWNP